MTKSNKNPETFFIHVENNEELLEYAKEDIDGQDYLIFDKNSQQFDIHSPSTEIFLNDDGDLEINLCLVFSNNGDKPADKISDMAQSDLPSASVGITVPLNDDLLIDILQHGVKTLNKVKSVLESAK